MKRFGSGLICGLAIILATGVATAQDGDDAGLELVQVPDSSLQVAFPGDWEVTTGLDYTHFDWLDPEGGYIGLVSAAGDSGSSCQVRMYAIPEGDLDAQAEAIADDRRKSGATAQVTTVELAVGAARRIDVQRPGDDYASEYLWHYDPASYLLTCHSAERRPGDWADVAGSLAWQADSRQAQAIDEGGADLQRVVLPTYGVALSLPKDFQLDREPVPYEMALPPDATEATPVTTVLTAWAPDGVSCGLEVFPGAPLTLAEHVAWVEEFNLAQPDFVGSISHVEVSLPAGEALRIDGDHQGDGIWTTMYLFDHDDMRYQFFCLDRQRAADDYRSIADTIEVLGGSAEEVPAWVPDDAVAWGAVEDFTTQVPVSHDETDGRVMVAQCERTVWLEYADGTFEERLDCDLTDEPVEPAELQGTPPTETVFFSGDACEWYSDYWYLTDGSERWAEAWSMSVEPDGHVMALATYGPEALECSAE